MNRSHVQAIIGALAALLVVAVPAAAQYQPIPDFSGVGAGYNFRQAINQRFSGAQAISPTIVSLPFASLPTEQDGMVLWCKDCQQTTPCAGGGAGAFASGARGVWTCAANTLEQDLNANGHTLADASNVQAQKSGDASPREQLKAGSGFQVSNGTAGPYTVIDENANVSGHINGTINVKAPPYNAKGDCATDDTAAIQAAINTACAENPYNSENIQPVYLPPTPSPGCYKITSPILVDCGNLHLVGAGPNETVLSPQFFGPDVIVQAGSNNAALAPVPLASNVTAAWQPSHSYSQYAEIRDSNGNIEVAITGGTSGSATPTWPASIGSSVADNSVTWTLEVIGSQLASGIGSAYDATIGGSLDLNWADSSNINLNGLSQFTIEFYVNPITSGYFAISDHEPPDASNQNLKCGGAFFAGAFSLQIQPLQACVNIGGTIYRIYASSNMTLNTIHHVALDYDGSTIRLFDNGAMVASTAASGTVVQQSFETVMFPGAQRPNWANLGSQGANAANGYYDSLRISNTARYTSNFTPPTAKFGMDSHTLLLINFPTNAPPGTVEGQVIYNNANVFIPVEVGSFATGDVLDGFEMCPGSYSGGIYATWIEDSEFRNIKCSFQNTYGVELYDNDFEDTLDHIYVGASGSPGMSYGFVFGSQSNGNEYNHLQCDGQSGGCIYMSGSSGYYREPIYTDRGSVVYPFVIMGRAVIQDPFTDMESGNSRFLADLISNAWAPVNIAGGELDAPNATGAHFAVNGGSPILDHGTFMDGNGSAPIVNIINPPSSPIVLSNDNFPSGAPLVNGGNRAYVVVDPPVPTTISGTAGTAKCAQKSDLGNISKFTTCYLSGYQETGAAQTYTYPVPFSSVPVLQESGGSCGTYNPSTTATTLTLPANAAMTAETCEVVVMGQ